MPPLPVVKSRQVFAAFERAGFVKVHQAGSHVKYRRGNRIAILKDYGSKDYPLGTLRKTLSDAGITIDEFRKLLEG